MLIFIGVGKIEIYLEGSDEQYFLEGSGEVQFGVERKVFPKYFPSKNLGPTSFMVTKFRQENKIET